MDWADRLVAGAEPLHLEDRSRQDRVRHEWRPSMFTAADLERRTYPAPRAYVEGLILEGLGILGGRPKLGKSWLCLRAALAIATGGVAFGNPGRAVRSGRVLYLALEDGEGRLQRRMRELMAPGERWPERLTFATSWPRLDKGGLGLLADTVAIEGYEVVFVDTIGRVRAPRGGRDIYGEDLEALAGLHNLTREVPGLATWLVHHNRKADHPDDYIDALSGSTGITGVVDHIAVLHRGRGEADAVVRFTSRDADEHETAFRLDRGQWAELGDAGVIEMSKARRQLLHHLEVLGGPATLTDLAELAGKSKPAVLDLLRGLESEGLVRQDGQRGPWNLANSPNTPNTLAPELGELAELGGSQHAPPRWWWGDGP